MENPKIKKGDIIILTESPNNGQQCSGSMCEVEKVTGNTSTVKVTSGAKTGSRINIYASGSGDIYVLADRKAQAAFVEEQVKEMEEKIRAAKQEIDRLKNFASEEEYVAYKIEKLLTTKGVAAKAKILKELKRSNYL